MTITASPSEQSYAADGISIVFAIPFPFDTAADLKLTSTDASGNILTLTTGFTISGGAGSTGNATFLVAPALGLTITIYDNPALTQPTDYVSLDAFPAESHERALDRVTRIAKRLYQLVQRSVRFPDGDVSTDGVLGSVANRKGKYLFFNAVTGAIEYAVNIVTTTLSQSIIGQLLNPQTLAESNAAVTPINYFRREGNVLRYGTNVTPGTTDMMAAIQAALNQAAQPTGASAYLPAGTYLDTAQLTIGSNVRFYGDGSSSIINFSSTAAADGLVGSNVTNSSVTDIKFNQTGVIAAANYFGLVAFRAGSSFCKIERCEITNHYTQGIVLNGTSNCRVVANYVHAANAAANGFQDSSDIRVDATNTNGSTENIVESNYCFGTNTWFGIGMEASTNPNLLLSKNLIAHNRIGQHVGYGILAYTHTAGDTYDEISDNYVENIQGTANGGTSGNGIYVALMTGVTVANNIVVNCCVASSSIFTQAGISINTAASGAPNSIVGNQILDMAQGNASGINICGIRIDLTPPGSSITGNTISQQVTPSGLTIGIHIPGGNSGLTITGNTLNILNTLAGTRGIFLFAVGANISNITVNGNTGLGCSSRGISCEQSGGFTVSNITINGNTVQGGSAASIPINVGNSVNGSVTGNTALATTVAALNVSASTGITYTGNRLSTTGTNAVTTTGACTGSLFDASNLLTGAVSNAATGFTIRQSGIVMVAYSASMTFDAAAGNEFDITATNNTAFTINAPTNPTTDCRITVKIRNTSGGALGAVTWNAVFKMSAWTSPATAFSRSIDFTYDSANWIQVAQTGVDVPN